MKTWQFIIQLIIIGLMFVLVICATYFYASKTESSIKEPAIKIPYKNSLRSTDKEVCECLEQGRGTFNCIYFRFLTTQQALQLIIDTEEYKYIPEKKEVKCEKAKIVK